MRELSPATFLFLLLIVAASLEGCAAEEGMDAEDYELTVTSTEAMETDMALEPLSSDIPELLATPTPALPTGGVGYGAKADPREVTKTNRTRGYKRPSEAEDAPGSSRPPAQ